VGARRPICRQSISADPQPSRSFLDFGLDSAYHVGFKYHRVFNTIVKLRVRQIRNGNRSDEREPFFGRTSGRAGMADRIEALEEVTLAIAHAAAERDAAFAEELGTQLRGSLQRHACEPAVFREAFDWLSRFEQGDAVPGEARDAVVDASAETP
jgi:hypothetical protein